MKYIIITIFFILSQFSFSNTCEELGILALSNCAFFRYEEAFEILNINYERCKDNCDFIRTFNRLLSLSTDNNFNKINIENILKEEKCKQNILPFGPIFYYLRKGDIKSLYEKFPEDKIRKVVGDYIFFVHLRKGEACNVLKNLYKKNKMQFFASYGAAYYFYKCGDIEKAREIASIRFNHFYKENKCLLCKVNDGLPNVTVEKIIYSLIFNIELQKDEKDKLRKSKEYFPYIFKLYDF